MQFFENRRYWAKAAGFCGLPGQGESLVQRPALTVRQIIALVVGHEIDGRPFGQGGRVIEDQPPVLDACSKRVHTELYGFD